MIKVAVSGGFDPVHIGHVRMFEEAKKLGHHLIVIVHSNDWLIQKKGYYFMDEKERCEIIKAFKCVDEVYFWDGMDRNVGEALKIIQPDIFANGGDRNEADAKNPNSTLYADTKVCKEFGIIMKFNVGGDKVQSSSDLVRNTK